VTIYPAEPATDFPFIAEHMRSADREEIEAASGHTPLQALDASFARSLIAFTAKIDGEPVAVFGVGDHDECGGIGIPWMLSTSAIEKQAVQAARLTRRYVKMFDKFYPILFNCVGEWNLLSRRWLRWSGFQEEGFCCFSGKPFVQMVRRT
jgi:hypothetical protein